MGATEEAGKVASGIVEALRAQPFMLAMILMNIICMGVVLWTLSAVADGQERRDKLIAELAKQCINRGS